MHCQRRDAPPCRHRRTSTLCVAAIAQTFIDRSRAQRTSSNTSISGDLKFIPGFSMVVDHCNGLLLCRDTTDGHDYVTNPATRRRRWARLPLRPTAWMREAFNQIECLVYDPTVSPHYEVLLIPSCFDQPKSMLESEMMHSEWPPSSYTLQVFSSITGCWEERSFVLEGGCREERWFVGEGQHVARNTTDTKVYWREALYALCENGFCLRISMPNAKYMLVQRPSHADFRYHGYFSLGRSEKGVYCAFQYDYHGLQNFLNESHGEVKWELKHLVDLRPFARKFHANEDYSQQHKGPWILQDINYYKYPYDNDEDEHKEVVEDNFEWNSDDDNLLNTEDMVEGHFEGSTGLLGFHPYEEIVFLDAALSRAVAYQWNTSKFQDLGNIFPKDYLEVAGHCAGIDTSFIYTPCWMDDFPENNLELEIED